MDPETLPEDGVEGCMELRRTPRGNGGTPAGLKILTVFSAKCRPRDGDRDGSRGGVEPGGRNEVTTMGRITGDEGFTYSERDRRSGNVPDTGDVPRRKEGKTCRVVVRHGIYRKSLVSRSVGVEEARTNP